MFHSSIFLLFFLSTQATITFAATKVSSAITAVPTVDPIIDTSIYFNVILSEATIHTGSSHGDGNGHYLRAQMIDKLQTLCPEDDSYCTMSETVEIDVSKFEGFGPIPGTLIFQFQDTEYQSVQYRDMMIAALAASFQAAANDDCYSTILKALRMAEGQTTCPGSETAPSGFPLSTCAGYEYSCLGPVSAFPDARNFPSQVHS